MWWLPSSCQCNLFRNIVLSFQKQSGEFWYILKWLFIDILDTSVLQLHIETEQNLNFHFKKCLWFWFFLFLVNCKYFRTSQTHLCFTIFPPCLSHFYINSYRVACLARNGQSENKAQKLQLVRNSSVRSRADIREEPTAWISCSVCKAWQACTVLTGFYYFLHAAESWEKQAHKDTDKTADLSVDFCCFIFSL